MCICIVLTLPPLRSAGSDAEPLRRSHAGRCGGLFEPPRAQRPSTDAPRANARGCPSGPRPGECRVPPNSIRLRSACREARDETRLAPAFIEHPPVMRVSSACWITGRPGTGRGHQCLVHDRFVRMGFPSSVTATAPADFSDPYSVSASPMLPRVAATIGNTCALAPRSGLCIQRVISSESLTGMVFGMAHTLVNPPAAAAAVPLAMVSL